MKLLRGFWAAPVAAGLLMGASFPPLDLGFLMPVAWTVIFLSMRLRRGRRAGMQLFVAWLVLTIPGVSWIAPLVWPLWFVVALWCAGWEGLWARWVAKRVLASDRPGLAWVVVLPVSHLFADMLRTTVISGFPWFLPGYSAWRNPVLLGSADLIGAHGATVAILVLAAGLAEVIARRIECAEGGVRPLVPAAALWAAMAAWAFGKPALEERPGPTLLLLQPNIPQHLKEEGRSAATSDVFWREHETLAAEAFSSRKPGEPRIDVVVWGETMVPSIARRPFGDAPLVTLAPDERGGLAATHAEGRRVAALARGGESLAGIQSFEPGEPRARLFNTVVLLDAEGRARGYQDKQHLTPGGEYIPLRSLIPFREDFERWLEDVIGFLPDLQPGEAGHVIELAGGARTGVLICYESVYPEVPRAMVAAGAEMLVNSSNYGWFAGSSEMAQALAMCAFRAAELRRSVVLASNNGISALVGPDGRVRGPTTEPDVRAHLTVTVPLCGSSSPFLAVGEWAAWVLGGIATAGAVLSSRRAARASAAARTEAISSADLSS